ncbi:hypothetical protein [Mariniluteicoccus endophyticus]
MGVLVEDDGDEDRRDSAEGVVDGEGADRLPDGHGVDRAGKVASAGTVAMRFQSVERA